MSTQYETPPPLAAGFVVADPAVAGVVAAGFVVVPEEPHADNPAATSRPRLKPRTLFRTIRRPAAISIPFSEATQRDASGVDTGDIAERMVEGNRASPLPSGRPRRGCARE